MLVKKKIPPTAMLLGTLLSSDKTNITAMTGDRWAHPLLISLANIKMEHRSKGSHHSFLLLALLPIPKFVEKNKKVRGVLESRLIHECLDLVLSPLKTAASVGVMLSDPRGFSQYCFTPLAVYVADTPEAAMLSAVGGKTSFHTMASYKQLGDSYQHEPRTASTMLTQLRDLASRVDPIQDIYAYFQEATKLRLNRVHQPFWRDWSLAEPCVFFVPEPLHHFHKQFWDHDLKWCINALGRTEIDFHFSVLQPHTGYRHFREGVSKIKQVTGRDHRNIQRYIVGIIAGATLNDFVIAIRALIEFHYLAQAPVIDDKTCAKIQKALQLFHSHKQAILDAGARAGKGNRPINHWNIPKLEMMQSVATNTRLNGVPLQWSADVTEHAHIEVVKRPGQSGNNQRYEEQICRSLDRNDKCL
jgi:Plavaka transposase